MNLPFIIACVMVFIIIIGMAGILVAVINANGVSLYVAFAIAGIFLGVVICMMVLGFKSVATDIEALYAQFKESKEEYGLVLQDDTLSDIEKFYIYDKAKEADEVLKSLKEDIEYNLLFVSESVIEGIQNETYILDNLIDFEAEVSTEEISHAEMGRWFK